MAVTKFAAFAITGSASTLAESVHSVADSGNQVLLLIGRNRAPRTGALAVRGLRGARGGDRAGGILVPHSDRRVEQGSRAG
jgi:hypothetical protein